MERFIKSESGLAWTLLILLSFIWGSSFILIKKALITFSAFEVGAARISISFLAFLPLFILHFKRIPWRKWKAFAVVGLCGSGFPAFLYAVGQTRIPSGVAGVINSMTPLFTLLLGVAFFGGLLIRRQLFGIALGLAGTLVLFFVKKEGELAFPIPYILLLMLATISYAISGNTVAKFLGGVRPLIISVVSFCIVGPFMLVYLLGGEFIGKLDGSSEAWLSLAAVSTLSLVGTFLANILFFRLIQLTDAVFSSSVSFLIPVVAIFWGVIDGEWLTAFHVLALVFILLGVLLSKRRS